MTTKPDNPQALPSPDWNGDWKGPLANHGMTLQDYFAAQALAGLLCHFGMNLSPEQAAILSYSNADAMLAKRAE